MSKLELQFTPPVSYKSLPSGHYMYIEVTGQTLGNMAVLNTPVFRKSSRDCSFEFWYNMRGELSALYRNVRMFYQCNSIFFFECCLHNRTFSTRTEYFSSGTAIGKLHLNMTSTFNGTNMTNLRTLDKPTTETWQKASVSFNKHMAT